MNKIIDYLIVMWKWFAGLQGKTQRFLVASSIVIIWMIYNVPTGEIKQYHQEKKEFVKQNNHQEAQVKNYKEQLPEKNIPVNVGEKSYSKGTAGGGESDKSKSSGDWVSPAGLSYGKDPSKRFETRIDHVMAHTKPDKSKRKHSIFIVKERQKLLDLLDEAWGNKGSPQRQGGKYGRDVYEIDMKKIIGIAGQHKIRLVIEADSSNVITAYPVR